MVKISLTYVQTDFLHTQSHNCGVLSSGCCYRPWYFLFDLQMPQTESCFLEKNKSGELFHSEQISPAIANIISLISDHSLCRKGGMVRVDGHF